MTSGIKSISVSRTMTSTETWTLLLNEDNEYHILRLIDAYKDKVITKDELFYEVGEAKGATSDEHISNEKFAMLINREV